MRLQPIRMLEGFFYIHFPPLKLMSLKNGGGLFRVNYWLPVCLPSVRCGWINRPSCFLLGKLLFFCNKRDFNGLISTIVRKLK